jgi:hypothetical protein
MRDFRKIMAWEKADDLVVLIYEVTKAFPRIGLVTSTGKRLPSWGKLAKRQPRFCKASSMLSKSKSIKAASTTNAETLRRCDAKTLT